MIPNALSINLISENKFNEPKQISNLDSAKILFMKKYKKYLIVITEDNYLKITQIIDKPIADVFDKAQDNKNAKKDKKPTKKPDKKGNKNVTSPLDEDSKTYELKIIFKFCFGKNEIAYLDILQDKYCFVTTRDRKMQVLNLNVLLFLFI